MFAVNRNNLFMILLERSTSIIMKNIYEHLANIFYYEIFLKLQCLVDELVDSLELSMFIDASLPLIYYLMKGIGDSDMKKNILI